MVTRSRVRGSQKQESRVIARNTIIKHCAKNTWISVQKSLLDGSLEETVGKAVSKIQPLRTLFFRRSQLIQSGVIIDDGPTLEEVIADETSEKEAPDTSDKELEPISEALGEESTSITTEASEIDTEELQTSSVEEGESESIKGEEHSDCLLYTSAAADE